MPDTFEVRWEGELPGTADQAWDAITVHSGGRLWPIDYGPWVGGADDVGVAAREKAWQAWLDELFRTNREAVA